MNQDIVLELRSSLIAKCRNEYIDINSGIRKQSINFTNTSKNCTDKI